MTDTSLESSWFRDAFETSPIGMALVAPDGKWLHVNNALPEMLQYTKDELHARSFQDLTHPEDLDEDLVLVQDMLDRKIENYQIEKRYIAKDESIVHVLLSVSLVWENEKPKHFISQVVDLTPMKKLQEDLKEKVHQLEVLNESMVGRELKMKELKEELARLKNED